MQRNTSIFRLPSHWKPRLPLIRYILILGIMASSFTVQGQVTEVKQATSEFTNDLLIGDADGVQSEHSVSWEGPGESGRVAIILQLEGMSLGEFKHAHPEAEPNDLAQQRERIDREQDAFLDVLESMEANLIEQEIIPFPATEVSQHYHNVLNGMAITTYRAMLPLLGQEETVLALEIDAETKASDVNSFPVIGLPCFQSFAPGVTGSGLRIGILDTGIDATHPDLGSGFGPGFKVSDWFDFAQGSATPVDVHGHGTHVAGIAAGSGAMVAGVAPDATIVAYRVLGNSGTGQTSWVIAAMDRATDPNQDGNTNDRLDVINLSLGAPGNSNGLTAQAANNASFLDVVVVAAIGNSGPNYQTGSVPALAEHAIAVGASNNNNQIASFSSRGPGNYTFNLKPDVLAPGVNINAAVPGGTTGMKSGSSMAAPHVAGAALLLRQLHPTWSPDRIKAMLMQTAVDIGEDRWTQGNGQIELCAAAQGITAVTPASADFGTFDCNVSTWTQNKSFEIHNSGTSTVTYQLSILQGTIPTSGVSASLSSSSVTVMPGGTGNFNLTLVVNSSCPDATAPIFAFEGEVHVTNGASVNAVPFAFTKSNFVSLKFDEQPFIVLIHDGSNIVHRAANVGLDYKFPLPAGAYDIMVMFWDITSMVVLENQALTNCQGPVQINRSNAIHDFTIVEKGIQNNTLPFLNIGGITIRHKPSNLFIATTMGGFSQNTLAPNILHLNGLSQDYEVDIKLFNRGYHTNSDYYDFPFRVSGPVTSGALLQNDPADFLGMDNVIEVPPGATDLHYYMVPIVHIGNTTRTTRWFGPTPNPFMVVQAPFEFRTSYFLPNPPQPYFYQHNDLQIWDISGGYTIEDSAVIYNHALISGGTTQNPQLELHQHFGFPGMYGYTDPIFRSKEPITEVRVGDYAPQFMGGTWITSNQSNQTTIQLKKDREKVWFTDQYGNVRRGDLNWTLSDLSGVLASGTEPNTRHPGNYFPISTQPTVGDFELSIAYDQFEIGGAPGTATAVMSFNSANTTYCNTPWLQRFFIRESGSPTDQIHEGDDGKIIIRVRDEFPFSGITSKQILVRMHSTTNPWISLDLEYDANEDVNWAAIPCGLASGLYDVQVSVKNGQGNVMDYFVEPAFAYVASSQNYDEWNWAVYAGGTATENPSAIARNIDGSLFLYGDYRWDMDFQSQSLPQAIPMALFLARYEDSGNEVWQVDFPVTQFARATAITTGDNGLIYVTGGFRGTLSLGPYQFTSTSGSHDGFVAAIDDNGNVIWAEQIAAPGNCEGIGIFVDKSGDVRITGTCAGVGSMGPFGFSASMAGNVFVARMDAGGNTIDFSVWPSSTYGAGTDIVVDAQGNQYLTLEVDGPVNIQGNTIGSIGTEEAILVCTDNNNNLNWAQFAQSSQPVSMIKLDLVGPKEELAVIGAFRGLVEVDGIPHLAKGNGLSVFISKFKFDGTHVWTEALTDQGNIYPVEVSIDGDADVFAAFTYENSLTINGLGTYTTSPSLYNPAVVKYSESGAPQWLTQGTAPSSGYAYASGMVVDDKEQVTLCGIFEGDRYFGNHPVPITMMTDMFMARFAACPRYPLNGLKVAPSTTAETAPAAAPAASSINPETGSELSLVAWPNPFRESLSISIFLPESGKIELELLDMFGKRVAQVVLGDHGFGTHEFQFDNQDAQLSSGVYMLWLKTDHGTISKRIMLQ